MLDKGTFGLLYNFFLLFFSLSCFAGLMLLLVSWLHSVFSSLIFKLSTLKSPLGAPRLFGQVEGPDPQGFMNQLQVQHNNKPSVLPRVDHFLADLGFASLRCFLSRQPHPTFPVQ